MIRCLLYSALSFLLLLFTAVSPVEAQRKQLSGKVRQAISNDPLSFAHLIINKGENHAFADINGEFFLESDQAISQIQVNYPLHQSVTIRLDTLQSDSLLVQLSANQLFVYHKNTDAGTQALMEKVFSNKHLYNPEKMRDFSYQSYNKFTLSYGKLNQVKSLVNKILKKFNLSNKSIDSTKTNQHLFMMESVTQHDYYNQFNHKEVVLASKVSGIEQSATFALTSQLQPFSIYEPETYLLGKHYNSPFTYKPFNWYYFETIDTAYLNQDTVYVVKFNPRHETKILFLKGYLYINTNGYAVQYHKVSPAIVGSVEMEYQQSYKQDDNGFWFPHQIQTAIVKDRLSTQNKQLKAIDRTTLYHLKRDAGLKKRDFDEIVLDYKNDKPQNDSFWKRNRKQQFSLKDSLTYVFYDSVGSIKNFENLIRLGEGIYYGEIPFKNVDLLLSRVLDFNQFEGFRLGLGLQTNERFMKNATFGAYWARGLKDDESKYGVYTKIKLSNFLNTHISFAYQNDLYESGDVELPFDYLQFSSESLRGYRISITDRIIRYEAALDFQPIKYVKMRFGFVRDDVSPLYDYDLEGLEDDFDFAEFRLGMRYAFGEHFMTSVHRKISFGTDYPVAWFQVTKGYDDLFGGEFDYTKWDFKVQKTTRTVGLGTSYVQLRAGWIKGRVPYQRLYRGRGSFRSLSTIARNSFETMGYNEFLSDRYVALFYSHDLGDIYIRRLRKQPSLVLSQNMGWGSLKRTERHRQFDFKTMERGYFESGAFLNNILVINAFNLKLGLGAGLYLRYGPYRLPNANDNLVFKIAVDFQL